MAHANIKYAGTTPGNDGNTYVLLATTLPAAPTNAMNMNRDGGVGGNFFPNANIKKVAVLIKCNQAGTLNAYESTDRGANWRQIDTVAVAAPGASASFAAEFLVEGLPDFKLEWVNGGTIQSPFDVLLSFREQVASAL